MHEQMAGTDLGEDQLRFVTTQPEALWAAATLFKGWRG